MRITRGDLRRCDKASARRKAATKPPEKSAEAIVGRPRDRRAEHEDKERNACSR